jgi:hypothetical protein
VLAWVLLAPVVSGPPCEGAELEPRVEHYLQGSGRTLDEAGEVRVELQQADVGWQLSLAIGEGSPRTFEAGRCEVVIDAAAFVLALAIDPATADRHAGPELVDEPEPDVIPEPVVVPPQLEPQPEPRSEPARPEPVASSWPPIRRAMVVPALAPFLELGIDGGSLPRVGALVRGGLGVVGSRWQLDVFGQVRTRSRAPASADPDVGGEIGAWALGMRACGVAPLPHRFELPICAVVEAGQAFGRGYGLADEQRARVPWLFVGGGPALVWVIRSGLALRVGVEIGATPLGGRFTIEDLGEVHDIGPLTARGLLGLQGRIPVPR